VQSVIIKKLTVTRKKAGWLFFTNFTKAFLKVEQLLNHIKNYHPLSAEAQYALHDCFEQVVLSKNEYLLNEGQVCRHLYFLEQGALRGFYTLDGKEITHWFGFEKDFVTSFHSFTTQKPAVENIQLVEGSILWAISKETLSGLFNQYHEIERLVRIAYENYYIRLEERFVNAQFKTATERYENLLQQTPHILERVPLGYIASYLGISQETLSRIRSRF
jgi:CRP-like cAMP-binding protein